jgi:hypothetical protein
MKKNFQISCALLLFCISKVGFSFDTSTHAAMTSEALKVSKFSITPNTSPILKRLGLSDKTDAFGEQYIDVGTTLTKRKATAFEADIMKKVRDVKGDLPFSNTIPGWIIRGVIREDDNTSENKPGTAHADEPGGVFQRVFGHFYDPVHDGVLTNAGISVGAKSPDWALTSGVKIPSTPVLNPLGGENHYNIPSAREAMWRALTLKKLNANGTMEPLVTNGTPAGDEAERKAYWATMFRSVGDVVHILQDGAQPQHTRNDAHSGFGCNLTAALAGSCVAGHDSVFEKYLKARTLGERNYTLTEGLIPGVQTDRVLPANAPQLNYGNYAVPKFTKYRDYFSMPSANGDGISGAGLMNYSNRGFYSFGTNIGNSNAQNFPSPSPTGAGLTELPSAQTKGLFGITLPGRVTFKVGSVQDTLFAANSATNVKLSAVGFFDQFLGAVGITPKHTLTLDNYDDHADLLIPRAVAYSAGLIDYYFRGEMKVFPPDEGVFAIVDHSKATDNCRDNCGFKQVKLKLANSTPDIQPSNGGNLQKQQMASGTLVALAKFYRNICYTSTLEGEFDTGESSESDVDYYKRCRSAYEEIVVSDPLGSIFVPLCDATITVAPDRCIDKAQLQKFTFPTAIPINATDLSLQVVYRGLLGEEQDTVVVETVDVAEPTYVAVVNTSDYMFCYNGQWRYKEADGSLPTGVPDKLQFRPFTYNAWRTAFEPNENDPANKYVATVANLAPKEFARIAVLTLKDRIRSSQISYGVTSTASEGGNLRGNEFQLDFISETQAQLRLLDYKDAVRKVRAAVTVFANEPYGDAGQPQTCPAQLPPHPGYPPHTKPTAIKPVTIVFPF